MNPEKRSLGITREFVADWSSKYDSGDGVESAKREREVRQWLVRLPEPKYLDKETFLKVAKWKSARPSGYYKRNSASSVEGLTRLAYLESDPETKVRMLMALRGVSVAVAGTILHFLHPDRFAIFDVRCRATLERAGRWKWVKEDDSVRRWLEYVEIMRSLAQELGVTLRELEKALWKYDKDNPLGATNP